MSSVWIKTRPTKDGGRRYRVEYRLGGRESRALYGGSFKTRREANLRRDWVRGELVALRVPNLLLLADERPAMPTFAQAAAAWRETRVDVAEGTRVLHRVALGRALPRLGDLRVDEISVQDVVELVTALATSGAKRETIRKTLTYVAAVFDEAELQLNPARDRRVRLPHEEREELVPPSAEHVEMVCRRIPAVHVLPLLFLDWSGARVAAIDKTLAGDYDESRRRVRLRAATTKTRQALWVELHPVLAEALEATLPHRHFRDHEAKLFAGSGADALRTSIAKVCKAEGIPIFSPHDLRHRRISLLHRQGCSWAEIARFVGQWKLSLTADTYTHVLIDGAEVDYAKLVAL
jgi:integrase